MCLGLPMRVVEGDEVSALVHGCGERRVVSLLLVGAQAAGTPLLVHRDAAVRVLGEDEVPLLELALDGLAAAFEGRPLTGFFADLEGRQPELPAHLLPGGSP